MRFEPLSRKIIGACIEVHRHLGAGLLESVYEECLAHELQLRGIAFERQNQVSLQYKAMRIEHAFQADLIVENELIVEIKAVRELRPVHSAQLRTFLKLTGTRVGLLVNFNSVVLKDGIRRVVMYD